MGPQLPAILQHFPMLEELALPACYMTETMEPPVPGVGGGQMPALRSYYGPYPLLPQVISADTSLTELSLCDFGCHGRACLQSVIEPSSKWPVLALSVLHAVPTPAGPRHIIIRVHLYTPIHSA
ncbi:hypothetical protein DXG01_015439, partial [Tephrocybe rancida]